ncbi:Inositol-tetrakisphosphate 1-kinase 1 [Bienertia sinuspersici]
MPEKNRKLTGTVGYAMPPNKVKTVIQPSLVAYAKERGIHLIEVHIDQPLIEQGPFDCLMHKVYDDDWKAQLRDYESKYPAVVIIDSPSSFERLHNRVSMLEVVSHLPVFVQQSDTEDYSFGIPKQESLSTANEKLSFPVIAKPLLANGSHKSHELSLVFNSHGLKYVEPPVVVQEFVNHGGVLFKVYVAGDYVKCVKRRSLPDFQVCSGAAELEEHESIRLISEISSSATEDDETFMKEAEMPAMSFIYSMAKGLREATKLHLFNFDMIKDAKEYNKYVIIDINYLPGFAKVPGFEVMLTDFFLDVINHKCEDVGGDRVGFSSETAILDNRVVKKEGNCLTILYNHVAGLVFRLLN